ncbi:MAG: F0F1 ATP synthase subunit B [Acidiferrobacterales bacterium]
MHIDITLLVQIFAFTVFVLFVRWKLWSPVTNVLSQRQKRIADSLAVAERARHESELASKRARELLRDAHKQADEIISKAQQQGVRLIEEAKGTAREEGQRIIASSRDEVTQMFNRARLELQKEVAELAVAGAKKILRREIDLRRHDDVLGDLLDNFYRKTGT